MAGTHHAANPLVLDSEVGFYLFGVINNAVRNTRYISVCTGFREFLKAELF